MHRASPPHLETLESREVLSNSIVFTAANGVLVIDGTSVRDTVVVTSLATNLVTVRMDHPGSNLPSQTKAIFSPISKIVFNGYDGNDRFENRTAIPTTATGGAGDDLLLGGRGADFLDGGDGNDQLYGGVGNDQLYGGNGDDIGFAGIGDDALCGGQGRNLLTGGAGADRFLVASTDILLDQNKSDVRINFVGVLTSEPFGDETITGTHAFWDDSEIQTIDYALGKIQQRTRNTTLLKMPDGSPLTFRRQGHSDKPEAELLGWNALDGKITFLDPAFTDPHWLHRSIYHEIGHNWEGSEVNPYFDSFAAVSGWAYGEFPPDNDYTHYMQAPETALGWWYKTGSTFARDYGRTDLWEDWAVSMEAYFLETYTGEMEAGAALIPTKLSIVNQFLTSKTKRL